MTEVGPDDGAPDDPRQGLAGPPPHSVGAAMLALGRTINTAATAIDRVTGGVGESISRTAASAGELLSDGDLRRQGASFIIKEASRGLELGADLIGRQLQWGMAEAPRHLQAALERVQARVNARRLAGMLEAERNQPVDVQIGRQVYEDAPQDLRARFWMVMLERQQLLEALREVGGGAGRVGVGEADGDCGGAEGRAGEEGSAGREVSDPEEDVPVLEEIDMSAIPGIGEGMPGGRRPAPGMEAGSKGGDSREGRGRGAGGQSMASEDGWLCGDDGWEVVEGGVMRCGASSSGRASPRSPDGAGDPAQCQVVRDVFAEMLEVPWPLQSDYSPDSRYGTLLQITVGQGEVDDVIYRDIHRTFPEHPQFAASQGQMSLFRVLKAYSLHDLEVGYCQGMAFVAGVVLLYLPEEPAFRLFCQLMQTDGPNLRRYYLPGLVPLKCQVWKFEWLLRRHLWGLYAHMEAHGMPAMMYCSQWLLTLFSCPFPPAFSARMVDIMLLEGNDDCLLRTAISVMANCCEELVEIDDFEEIMSVLKVGPMEWPVTRMRKVLELSLSGFINSSDLRAAQAAWEVHQKEEEDKDKEEEKEAEACKPAAAVIAAMDRTQEECLSISEQHGDDGAVRAETEIDCIKSDS